MDLAGEVVGVNTAVVGNGRGFGVLLPGHVAARVAAALERDGRIAHACAGVTLSEDRGAGANVTKLEVRSAPAAEPTGAARLRPGDVLVAIDGTPVKSLDDFGAREFMASPGVLWTVDVDRGGRRASVTLPLSAIPCDPARGRR